MSIQKKVPLNSMDPSPRYILLQHLSPFQICSKATSMMVQYIKKKKKRTITSNIKIILESAYQTPAVLHFRNITGGALTITAGGTLVPVDYRNEICAVLMPGFSLCLLATVW